MENTQRKPLPFQDNVRTAKEVQILGCGLLCKIYNFTDFNLLC